MTQRTRQWIAVLLLMAGVLPPAAPVQGQPPPSDQAPTATAPAGGQQADTRPVRAVERSRIEDKTVASGGGGGMWVAVLRTVLALAVVAALIFGLRILLRRFGAGRLVGRTSGPVSVLGRTSVSPRQQLLLIRVGRRLVLVGSGPEGMAALMEIRDADEVADLVRLAEGGDRQAAADAAAGGPEDRP